MDKKYEETGEQQKQILEEAAMIKSKVADNLKDKLFNEIFKIKMA